jgi:hypothetical protein
LKEAVVVVDEFQGAVMVIALQHHHSKTVEVSSSSDTRDTVDCSLT